MFAINNHYADKGKSTANGASWRPSDSRLTMATGDRREFEDRRSPGMTCFGPKNDFIFY